MHEYSIASSLLRLVEEHARKHEATRVVRIGLRVGELSGVEVDLLATAWSLVRERSLCDGVDLEVRAVPARWACGACGAQPEPGAVLACPDCGGRVGLTAGDDLVLDRIEMEVS